MNFDIFFLSFDEPNANENWRACKARFPRARRVHGIPGILNAHKACANQSESEFFFVVNADNRIQMDFTFEYHEPVAEKSIYVWRCKNPINALVYGYGAIKLFPKRLVLETSAMALDMSTAFANCNYTIVPIIASTTYFNSSPFNAWRSAFRECAKLSSQAIPNQKNDETQMRLQRWTNFADTSVANYDWCLRGALEGKLYIESTPATEWGKINDFDWLQNSFREQYGDL